MKQKDIALIAIIVVFSAVISLVVSKMIFGGAQSREQQAEVVQPITTSFPQPDKKYFNSAAFDPTQPITIGQNANTDPFRGTASQ